MTVSICEEMNPLRRNTMEDVHAFYAPGSWSAPDPNATFIGVYDGHGGRSIVDYLDDHLVVNVANEWKHSCGNGDGQSKKRRLDDEDREKVVTANDDAKEEGHPILTVLERAFLLTDIESRMEGIETSGATVACCVIVPHYDAPQNKLESIAIHCANAGDARIVLSSSSTTGRSAPSAKRKVGKSSAVRLTCDHKATDPKEISRIQSAGGMMLRGRVLGVLAVARSLGDHGLKEFVIGRPYLSSTVVNIEKSINRSNEGTERRNAPFTDGEFLIVACDGLWDVVDDQEAVDLVRNFVDVSDNTEDDKRERSARFLIDEALRRGSTDNITVIVYWL